METFAQMASGRQDVSTVKPVSTALSRTSVIVLLDKFVQLEQDNLSCAQKVRTGQQQVD